MSAGQPWMKFYPADWQSDQALRLCSLAARGLWIECMAIMHRAVPYGHLVVNGRAVTEAQLGVLAGAPPDQITQLLGELEAAGVFSRTRAGVVYSRRMVEDSSHFLDLKPSRQTWQTLRDFVFRRDDYTCQYCGQRGGKLECDHVVPVSRGGANDVANLATACKACNRSKAAMTPEEWRRNG